MSGELAKTYKPGDFEDRIYRTWEESGSFHAETDERKIPFTIVMPPPNITGRLHMGHALDQTLQDVLARWRRMQGRAVLWLPGTDHASIATELKVAGEIREKEGKSKEDLGREEFLKRAWEWKGLYGGKIAEQMRKLGNSCDWRRERFTMDEGCSRAVKEFFVRLYKKGYIYRGNRIINWCPGCMTSLSDVEVEHEDVNGKYWYFRYLGVGGGDIVVATSRPETMFGDVAVAVHPDDVRYKRLIGAKVELPVIGREIPVIADVYPDPDKGTGAVKITPAHDANDFAVGERHNLEKISCIGRDGKMNNLAGKYAGMDRFECRKAWVRELEDAGFLVKTEKRAIPAGTCYRCGAVVEPLLSDQWFVSMSELAKPAAEAARSRKIVHTPERFEKVYLRWLDEIKDWCVSRQLWWGHRIPAYYCGVCGEIIVSAEEPDACPACGSAKLRQDEDVLDTWFSSAIWPFSTLGWPEETADLKYFYPTDVLVTGYDIIFFWVARMAFSGLEVMKDVPFRHVYVHGLVRDAEGRKMSKSLGNGVDPLEIINNYGADALRFTLLSGVTPGNDVRFQTEKLEASRNFANKLWNASRFVIMNLKDENGAFLPVAAAARLRGEDVWILSKADETVREITANMEAFELSLAARKIYELTWNEYCDWYIEFVKSRLYGTDEEDKQSARHVLLRVLRDILRLLHPFMPYITEEIWSFLPRGEEEALLINESWPAGGGISDDGGAARKIELAMEAIRGIRNLRAEAGTAPSKKLRAVILAAPGARRDLEAESEHLKNVARLSEIVFASGREEIPEDAMSAVVAGAEIFIPMDELLDYEAEFERLSRERRRLESETARISAKLSNAGFTGNAPEAVVAAEREKLLKYEDMLAKVTARLGALADKR